MKVGAGAEVRSRELSGRKTHKTGGLIRLKSSFGGKIKGAVAEERREERFRGQERVRFKGEGLRGRTRSRGIKWVVKEEIIISETKLTDMRILLHSWVHVPISVENGFEGHGEVVLFRLNLIIDVWGPRRNCILFLFSFSIYPDEAVSSSKDHLEEEEEEETCNSFFSRASYF